jgi:hypothetical protein
MGRGVVFAFLFAGSLLVRGQVPVNSYEALTTRLFGDARAVTKGALASILLRIFRPHGTDLQIVVRVEGNATSLSAVETHECLECALGIAGAKGPELLRSEFLRLASLAPRRSDRLLTNATADSLFEEAKRVIANRVQAFSLEDGRTKIVLHAPYYAIELKTGLELVRAEFHAGDFEDKNLRWGKNDFIPFIRRLVAASGLRPSN